MSRSEEVQWKTIETWRFWHMCDCVLLMLKLLWLKKDNYDIKHLTYNYPYAMSVPT